MYVTNEGTPTQPEGSVTVYGEGVNGNVAPIRTLSGPKTGLDIPAGIVYAGNIYVTNSGDSTITVYPGGAKGNVAPTTTIGGPNTLLNGPVGIAL